MNLNRDQYEGEVDVTVYRESFMQTMEDLTD